MGETNDKKQEQVEAMKPEPKQKIEREKQPRELTPEEVKSVAGGPAIFNDGG